METILTEPKMLADSVGGSDTQLAKTPPLFDPPTIYNVNGIPLVEVRKTIYVAWRRDADVEVVKFSDNGPFRYSVLAMHPTLPTGFELVTKTITQPAEPVPGKDVLPADGAKVSVQKCGGSQAKETEFLVTASTNANGDALIIAIPQKPGETLTFSKNLVARFKARITFGPAIIREYDLITATLLEGQSPFFFVDGHMGEFIGIAFQLMPDSVNYSLSQFAIHIPNEVIQPQPAVADLSIGGQTGSTTAPSLAITDETFPSFIEREYEYWELEPTDSKIYISGRSWLSEMFLFATRGDPTSAKFAKRMAAAKTRYELHAKELSSAVSYYTGLQLTTDSLMKKKLSDLRKYKRAIDQHIKGYTRARNLYQAFLQRKGEPVPFDDFAIHDEEKKVLARMMGPIEAVISAKKKQQKAGIHVD